MPDLDPAAVVRVLNKHGVRFVVIGGIAAQLHDLPVPATVDIDVTPARDSKNLISVRLLTHLVSLIGNPHPEAPKSQSQQ